MKADDLYSEKCDRVRPLGGTKMKKLMYELYKRREKILILLVGFFFGTVVGIFLAPAKNGITIGSYNGNNSAKKKAEEEFQKDLAMEMGELR